MSRRLAAIAAALCSLAIPSLASAESSARIAFRLEYEPPEGTRCPRHQELAYTVAGEFGEDVIRESALAIVRVEIRRAKRGYEALVWAPDLSDESVTWHGKTEPQDSCRELAYDIAALLNAQLGPKAWPNGVPPAIIAAPPEIEVRLPAPTPTRTIVLEQRSWIQPRVFADEGLYSKEALPVRLQVGAFALVYPIALSHIGVGGGFNLYARRSKFALGLELRLAGTPKSGIGDPPRPGRTTVMTAALLPCLGLTAVDLCAAATISNLDFELPSYVRLAAQDGVSAGFGAHVNGKLRLSELYSLTAFGEVTGELRRISLRWQDQEGTASTAYNWASPSWRMLFGVGFLFMAY